MGSDSEQSENGLQGLFGSDSEDENPTPSAGTQQPLSSNVVMSSDSENDFDKSAQAERDSNTKTVYNSEKLFGSSDEDDEIDQFGEEQPEETEVERIIERPISASIPNLNVSKNSENLFLIKLPSLLTIQSSPFDATDLDQDPANLSVLNTTIRWRHQTKQEPESNARLVRWSDNSYSLLVGDEFFDVGITDITSRNQFLTVQHPSAELMKVETRFNKVMAFRPHSTESLAHKKMIMQLNMETKQNKTRQKVVLKDPEQAGREALKLEQEKEKQRRKLEAKRRQSGRTLGEDGIFFII